MTGTLTAGTLVSAASILERRLKRGVRRDTLYAPIDEHHTAAADSDVAAAWVAAGLVGLGLLGLLAL